MKPDLCGADIGRFGELHALCPGAVFHDLPLRDISRWKVGGLAQVLVRPGTISELMAVRQWLHLNAIKHVVVGATSNLIFSDAGLGVVCIQLGENFSGYVIENDQIQAAAGIWVPRLASIAMRAGLTGLEHVCGIPGTLGGLVCMNGGSRRQSVGDVIDEVISIDHDGGIVVRKASACDFTYRRSIFQSNAEVIAGVRLQLGRSATRAQIRREMLGILAARRARLPQKQPHCGSVFVSSPQMHREIGPPGAVIERIGLKGLRVGGASVSMQHANVIVNDGSATAGDILQLIRLVKARVLAETGYAMQSEVRYLSADGELFPADADSIAPDE